MATRPTVDLEGDVRTSERRAARRTSRASLLKEALYLERLGGCWEIQHVEAFTGYASSSVRALGCPSVQREGEGVSGRGRVLYEPARVREWFASRLRKGA